MKKYFNKILKEKKKLKKEWIICFLVAIGFIVACEGAIEDGNPFGPSNSSIIINPSTPKINKGGTQTFTAFGGTLPVSWSISNTQIGAIDAGTGVFTSNQAAPQVAGTSTVTVVDAVGDTDTATIEVLPNPLNIAPGSSTQNVAGSQIFTVTGASGTANLAASIANNSTTSTFTLPTLVSTATAVTVTFAKATTTETFTISISDTGNGDVGSVILTLIP
ncbi:MAG: hypothetical protein HOK41_13375 [Nitrospina sp.]|jgi:hypothetical protein|nr:hypothetical protein [Nitrospina sp.]